MTNFATQKNPDNPKKYKRKQIQPSALSAALEQGSGLCCLTAGVIMSEGPVIQEAPATPILPVCGLGAAG